MALVLISLAWLLSMASVALWVAPWWGIGAILVGSVPLVYAKFGRQGVVTLLAAATLALVGGWRFEQWQDRAAPDIARYVGQKVELEGEVASEPDPGLATASYEVEVRFVTLAGERRPSRGKVRISVNQYAEYLPGTGVRLSGKVEEPPVFPDFDYRSYLARRGVVGTMYFPRVEVTSDPGRWGPGRNLAEARLNLQHSLERSLPEPEASLGAGVAFGRDGNIPDDLYGDFRTTGLAHIVAVSGSNVTLVTALTFLVTVPLFGRRWALIPAVFTVGSYLLIAGLSPSVMRAGVMALVFLLGTYLGRQQSTLSALGAAAVAMTAWSPAVARDLGFQLSLSATAGLVVFGPWIRWALHRAANRRFLRTAIPGLAVDVAALTLSATVATLPITWVNFGQVSLVGPVANVVVEPAFVLAFWLSAGTAVAGLLNASAGQALGLLAYYPLAFTTSVARGAANLPLASLSVPSASGNAAFFGYAVLAALGWPAYRRLARTAQPTVIRTDRRRRRSLLLAASAGACAVLVIPISLLPGRGPGAFEMTVLDVGQGDAILLTTPSGRRFLVDGGPSGIELARQLGAVLPHWSRGIEGVFVTHPQEDHIAGVPEILDRYHVKLQRDTGVAGAIASYAEYRKRSGDRIEVHAGDSFDADGVRFEVLWPPADYPTDDLNNTSIILRVTYGEIRFLLTGDSEGPAQRALMAMTDVSAAVLKVPHHGSKTTDPAFLAAVNPVVAVIPVGADNRFGHPSPETLDALAAVMVWRTDQSGRVTIRSDGKRLTVTTQR
ncbi:MAG: DNA internalization-related competence protein ComEC/Rec2 [Anaerolineaceae bacterium]